MQNQQSSQWLCLLALSHSDIFRSWSWSPHPFSSCQWLLELKLLQLRVTSMKKQLLIPKKGPLHELLVSKWFKSFCISGFVAPSTTLSTVVLLFPMLGIQSCCVNLGYHALPSRTDIPRLIYLPRPCKISRVWKQQPPPQRKDHRYQILSDYWQI